MIIVSQNKEQIVNFDNIEILFLIQKEVWYQGIYGEGYQLAEYKTEERAKKVLQEIIRTAECNGYTNVLQKTAVYEMPEE